MLHILLQLISIYCPKFTIYKEDTNGRIFLFKTFTSGKISAIDTGSASQYKNRMGHNGSQRRVAFQNTAFAKDPGLWEVNGMYANFKINSTRL